MVKQSYTQKLEERLEELRQIGKKNVLPVYRPKDTWEEFEQEVMSENSSVKKKITTFIFKPGKGYDLREGIEKEIIEANDFLNHAMQSYSTKVKSIVAQGQKISLLEKRLEYAISVSSMFNGELQLDKQDVIEEQEDTEIQGTYEQETAEEIKPNNREEVIDAIHSYTQMIEEKKKTYDESIANLDTFVKKVKVKTQNIMPLLGKIELFREYVQDYATTGSSQYILERLDEHSATYLTLVKSKTKNSNANSIDLVSTKVMLEMEKEKQEGKADYMSKGIVKYFEERCKLLQSF
ncbi:hypothetical protein HN695_02640 [Candidatus Woesearchaeota archaeon]|jgi:hypothetical protein|nr:hypothetical protein [Candidatus Woesearchaeota archaeon]MBT5271988.1 hypothetical protein [Candidatus Woesearchaeota archaeon]MBT6040892.1 hypothetical protein [Candidatus Woesearchaeota archaeon]MBT6336770.1 hypothetical protein [Candidatus Woesearchaeota archaeon]MBT7927209.1 hypothetical protein [Candidatus Woesearchaeota archaeon]